MSDVELKRPLTEGQKRLLQAMPEIADSRFPEVHATVPASNYVDPARFDREIKAVFHAVPVIAAPSSALPEPNSYCARDVAGMPMLISRTKEGKIKIFANVCRHRGAKLCNTREATKGSRVVCPYHAWTYALDGRLIGLPRHETFPGLEKEDLGLIELPSAEAGGLIWVGLDHRNPADFSVTHELGRDFDAMGLGDMHIYDSATFKVQANWKLIMDSMLDSYHVTRLHKDSLARFFVDTENIIDRVGPHIRVAAARGNFERRFISDDFEQIRKYVVFAYIPFPNGIVVVSPHFVSLGIVRPLACDRTEVDYYMLVNERPANADIEDKMRRSFQLMEQAFGREDYWAAEQCDAGLRSGLLPEVHLGGMEVQITMFQNEVTKCLERMYGKQ
ncbi:MAG TPA: aromatic ring-hydroxylating dioxygenase subunit alpha [Sphingomonadales bacterium]